MLQTIRERAQGLVAAVIVVLLILTFAVWGIESYLKQARRVVVASVDGDKIELAAYQQTYQRMRQRAQAELGDKFDARIWADEKTKLKALDFVVEEHLLTSSVDHAHLRVSSAQVSEYLKSSPNFQVDGKFSRDRYAQVTRMLGYSERGFEDQARNDLALQQLRAGVAASAFVTTSEAQNIQQLREQKRTIGYALLAPTDASKEIVKPTDVAAYYDKNKEDYRIQDKVALEYIDLKLVDLKSQVTVNDELLTAYYDSHKADFTVEEQRNANHILIQVKSGAGAADTEKARQKAQKMRELVMGGKEFETVAKENSDDIGSRSEGGETGLFSRGVMAPEFEQAVFSMKVGEVSEAIKTSFGFHIIKLRAIAPGGIQLFLDVKAEVEAKYRAEQAENQYFDAAERFSDAVYEHPDALAESGDTLGLAVHTTSLQFRSEVAALFNDAVADAVWEPEVLSEGLASAPIEIGSDRIVAVRVTQHEPSRVQALDEVKDSITATLQTKRVVKATAERGASIIGRLQKGDSLASVIAAEKLDWKEHKDVAREDPDVNRAVLRAAFKVPVLKDAGTAYRGIALGTGSYAVIAVSNPQIPAVAQLDKAASGLQRDMERNRTASVWLDFVAALRANVEVETYPKNL